MKRYLIVYMADSIKHNAIYIQYPSKDNPNALPDYTKIIDDIASMHHHKYDPIIIDNIIEIF